MHTNFNGIVLTNSYDSMNRLLGQWFGSTNLAAYTYTSNGRRLTMTDASGTSTYMYDVRDRLKTNVTPEGTLFYLYDANGNLTNISSATSGGVSTVYQYDALNRLTNVIDNGLAGTKNTAYTFDRVGNLAALKYPNWVTNLYRYYSLNRLTNLAWGLSGSSLAGFKGVRGA